MGLSTLDPQCGVLVRLMLSRPEPVEVRIDPEAEKLERRFSDLVETCSRFAQDIVREAGWNGGVAGLFDPVTKNMEIARTVFGKWSLDILTLLYLRQGAGFQELRRSLGPISSRVLSSKLTRMQETGLIRRDVKPTRPPRVTYSLTEHGQTVAKLGEPVFLYLRLASAEPKAEPTP
jgi:DNA-binding HxlR family transcriptional regulator